MPRTAATFAWLGVIAVALATNISRYPLVTQMVQNAYRAEAAASSPSPGGAGLVSDSAGHGQSQSHTTSPKPEEKLAASPEKPAIASQPEEHESPPAAAGEEIASPSARPVAFSQPMAPIEDAGASPANAVDPLDLGNGVRRLPPVE